MNVAIIGAGLIGNKRATALERFKEDRLVHVVDIVEQNAKDLAQKYNCNWSTDWQAINFNNDVDAVVIATSNEYLAQITVAAACNGKHVLCEKPLGRNVTESIEMVNAAKQNNVILKTGFNHRHHPAIWKAKHLVAEAAIGELFFIRARYGHGARPGLINEWRGNKEQAGGGELLDQGVHIFDLCRWFMGEFQYVFGQTPRYFWPIQSEDNGFVILKTGSGKIAHIHVSWTNWKNIFSFEIFGEKGYIQIDGLGASYGTEKLTLGIRKPESGPPDVREEIFDGPDNSWIEEWKTFRSAINNGTEPIGGGIDGLKAVELVNYVYRSNSQNQVIEIMNETC